MRGLVGVLLRYVGTGVCCYDMWGLGVCLTTCGTGDVLLRHVGTGVRVCVCCYDIWELGCVLL
jgi:hypothetical protein